MFCIWQFFRLDWLQSLLLGGLFGNAGGVWFAFSHAVLLDTAGGEASDFGGVTVVAVKLGKSQFTVVFQKPSSLDQGIGKTFASADLVDELFCKV